MNPNCDGSGPHILNGEVRVLPTSGDGNAILCKLCYRRELAYRKERNLEFVKQKTDTAFDLPAWESLKVYA